MNWDHKHICQIDKTIISKKNTLSSYLSEYSLSVAELLLQKKWESIKKNFDADLKQELINDFVDILDELDRLSFFIYKNSIKLDLDGYYYMVFDEKKARIFFDTF